MEKVIQYIKKRPLIAIFGLIMIAIPILGFFLSFCITIWLSSPNLDKEHASEADKTYVSYIEQGNKYYSSYLYDKSLAEFDKALAIHDDDPDLYSLRAQSYKMKGEYEKAIEEAKKGISVLDNKSIYYSIKGYYKFEHPNPQKRNKNIASYLYLYWAGSAMKLGRYEEAIEGYTGLIANVKYTYSTDAYFKRGLCYYYSGNKKAALDDFYKHKETIHEYFSTKSRSGDFGYAYNEYSTKDIEKIDKWIALCEKELGIKQTTQSYSNDRMVTPPDFE